MADDIVNRLREMATDRARHATHSDGCVERHLECAALHACDEIERLEQYVEELRSDRYEWVKTAQRQEAEIERMRAALSEYGTRSHYECEDSWYSCPRSADGCCDDRQGDGCNCGADEHNAEVRRIIAGESGRV